uniref:Leucine rich pentatricopeptide repeat containing n=1 Tax=Gadus morhua TaxID=8049 RepID=A0A8C5FBZ4_GADMO
MAALLRSSRLLNFSPSGVLKITGTKVIGPPLSRLYSRAVGGQRAGVGSRQFTRCSENVSRQAWPYVAGSVRSYALATEPKEDGNLGLRSKQAQQFDWALAKLDSSVRRTGRVTKTLLLRIFHDNCRTGHPSGNQALLLLRSCGSLLPEIPMAERTELAHRIWEKLQELGAMYDASHYNALLKVYLQNEFKFSPTDFLAKMEAANVLPNRVTYQRLIAAYCHEGDIEGASTILGFMKSKDLAITEAVFNSLVTGHARSGDIESAKNILLVMRGAGIEPGPDTYVALLTAYAEKGDITSIKQTIEVAESADCSLMHRDMMQVIFSLARAGYQQHVPEMTELMRHDRGFVPDAMNLCLSLITQRMEDTAFGILQSFPAQHGEVPSTDGPTLGSFFLRHCVHMDMPVEKLARYCKELQESNLHTSPLHFTLACALETRKTDMCVSLMKVLKEQGLPVRPHFFYPLLTQHVKDKNTAGTHNHEEKRTQALKPFIMYLLMYFACEKRSINCHQNVLNTASFLLYNLVDSMTEAEVRAHETKLQEYFNKLSEQITISFNIYRGMRNLLDSYQVPELIKVNVFMSPTSAVQSAHLHAPNPIKHLTLCLFVAIVINQDLERALEMKQQYEDEMTTGTYAVLINLCCRHDNLEEALSLKRELSRRDSSVALDAGKYIGLMKALTKSGRVEEAMDILKEMKEKEVVVNDANASLLFHALNNLGAKGDAASIRQLQDTIFSLGLAKPTANLCSPLITAYLHSNDLSAALEAAMECQKRYGQLPRIHDVIVGLVETGDTELLQKAMDFVSQERGEMTMLYDLYFAFMQTNRFREARKIIETPGLRAKAGRIQWYAEKCIAGNQMESLEQMVEMTAKLFECDRDEMYSYILRSCKSTNDWKKAESVWTKMQEENVVPRERTLRLLADILKSNGQEVPFEVPKVKARSQIYCLPGFSAEAMDMLVAAGPDVALGAVVYDHIIRALLATGALEDAMTVKDMAVSRSPGFQLSDLATNLLIITYCRRGQATEARETLNAMLQADLVPSQLCVTRLVQELGNQGDVAAIQEVEALVKGLGLAPQLSSMVFVNNTALAHIKNGDLATAIELLDGMYTSAESTQPSMAFVFRKMYEQNNEEAIDKLAAMSERLANHFACYRPATDLFFQLLDMDKLEDAKAMLMRCGGLAEQKDILLSYTSRKARRPGQVDKIKALHSLIPDYTEKDVHYSYLMKCYGVDNDLSSAKALFDQMEAEGVSVHELSLKRLAVLYRNAGEALPFPEPPVSLLDKYFSVLFVVHS